MKIDMPTVYKAIRRRSSACLGLPLHTSKLEFEVGVRLY